MKENNALMILTCPKCASRFLISAQALAPEGRKVKCSACSEMWFQLPDPDELIKDIEDIESGNMPVEDIPDAVKPIPEGSAVPALSEEDEGSKPKSGKITVAICAALFLLLIAPIFMLKGSIMSAWPESLVFYKAIGIAGSMPGEGLVFDQLRAETQDKTVIITGQIINLTSKDKTLPIAEVVLGGMDGKIAAQWYIAPPQKILKAEAVIPFTAKHELPENIAVKDIRVRFVLKAKGGKIKNKPDAKTASKDGGNTQSPHAGDSAAPHGGATSAKSPAHGGAPPHQETSHGNHDSFH